MKILKVIVITIFTLLLLSNPVAVFARTSQEIADEIAAQQKLLQQTRDSIQNTKNELGNLQNGLNGVQQGLPQLQAQIDSINKEIELNNLKVNLLNQSKKLKELQRDQKELERDDANKKSYLEWRTSSPELSVVFDTKYDSRKTSVYKDFLSLKDRKELNQLYTEILGISTDIDEFNKTLEVLSQQNADLQKQKSDLEAQIAYYNSQINSANGQLDSLNNNLGSIETSLVSLSSEQQEALRKEAEILAGGGGASVGGCGVYDDNNNQNSFYWCGLGRDLYQGHGVGMSQWGAHGYALNGFHYNDILATYYQNTTLQGGYENQTINVEGVGAMNIEDYVTGQAEVPARACGTAEQVQSNPVKYVLDNPNSDFDCWPEEAIKAQVVAFRTYALNYVQSHGQICTTTYCQAWRSDLNSRWAVDETRGQVLTYGGGLIETVYSADNNEGFGTANNDTVFQGYSGDATALPYLRSVNDTQFATRTYWGQWGYKSGNYTNQDLNDFLQNVANSPDTYGGGISNYVANALNSIGGRVDTLAFERDPSKRVKKVWIKSTNGSQAQIGGYWFKYLWNVWSNSVGRNDYIYSQTFFFHIAQ